MFDFQCAICFLNSYLSTILKSKFDHTAEAVLPTLINLIPNSAKVIPLLAVVTIQSWQAGDTVLQGRDTVLERLRYFFGVVTWQKQSYRGQRVQLNA